MKNKPNTYDGTESMGSDYGSRYRCAAAELYEWVTAGGNNPLDEALVYLREGREANLSEMAENDWETHILVVEDWDSVAKEVEEQLLEELGGEEE